MPIYARSPSTSTLTASIIVLELPSKASAWVVMGTSLRSAFTFSYVLLGAVLRRRRRTPGEIDGERRPGLRVHLSAKTADVDALSRRLQIATGERGGELTLVAALDGGREVEVRTARPLPLRRRPARRAEDRPGR